MRNWLFVLTCIAASLAAGPAFSQTLSNGLISSDVAHRYGLDVGWKTQIAVNRAKGRVTHVTQAISDWTYIEVKLNKLTWRYSERDRDRDGLVIGVAAAEELADAKVRDLKEHFLEPTVTKHVMTDVRLYVVTDQGMLHAIDGENGETLWRQQVGDPRFPTTAAGANDTYVAICNGSTIYTYDRRNGDLLWSREAANVISAGPAVTTEQVAVPTIRGSIESYRVNQDKRYAPYIYRSQGDVYMQPVTTLRSIVWATENGHMYVADAASGRARFRLEASGTIVGQPAYLAPRYIFATSIDGYVYCSDEINGDMLWRYSTGTAMSHGPVAVGDSVYVVTDSGELHAIDYKTGQLKEVKTAAELKDPTLTPPMRDPSQTRRWPVVSGIKSIVSVSPTRIYCQGRPGQLTIVDNNSGSIIGTMPIGMQDIVLHNQVTDRLILGTSTGVLQCLHEAKLVQPYVHAIEMEKRKSTRPEVVVDPGEEPMPEMPMTPPEKDPFGGKDDPFGAPPKKDPPPADDPFGGPAPPPKKEPPKPAVDDPFG